jgi:N6-adenosine-specific RNA methylase IME4
MEPIKYACVLADPGWKFQDLLPGKTRGAAKNYNLMTVDEICNFTLPLIADNAYLFMWRVSAMVPEAYKVINAWGFTAKSEIVWNKLTKKGKPWFGLGRHVRASHETCIVATRGKPVRLSASIRSTFSAPVPVDETGKYIHSAKPDCFYQIVEELCNGPRVEIFARKTREGWLGIGDQVGKLGVAV